jgi:hypothetical protein
MRVRLLNLVPMPVLVQVDRSLHMGLAHADPFAATCASGIPGRIYYSLPIEMIFK